MSAGKIWWNQLGNSMRLVDRITKNLKDCRSAVLQIQQGLPWTNDFYESVDIQRSVFGNERRLKRLPWTENLDPGEFVLNELCSPLVRAEYWPGQTYAEYLGSKDDIFLCNYYVWVTGIQKKADIVRWAEFITQYDTAAETLDQRAVFILEYSGTGIYTNGVDVISYHVESYDCRVFALETVAALDNTKLRSYQAELAISLCGGNPELCYALLEEGNHLLEKPVETAVEVCRNTCSSSGTAFTRIDEQQANSAAWEASVVLLFPILERFRMMVIRENEAELSRHLPISNSNGDKITEACDLEIGPLCYIVCSSPKAFQSETVELVRLSRRVRNLLAHNKIVPFEDVSAVMSYYRARTS